MVLAASDTAIRALIFSPTYSRIGVAACRRRDRGFAMCTVATIGPVADQAASRDRLGAAGSCTCSTSNWPSFSQRRTRLADRKPNATRPTEPL